MGTFEEEVKQLTSSRRPCRIGRTSLERMFRLRLVGREEGQELELT